jgi:hypothetical protein
MIELDQLAFRFFKLFAQYEYALKEMKFYKIRYNCSVEPDWDAFTNAIGRLVFDDQDDQIKTAIDYLLEHPPKRQVIKDGQLHWNDVSNVDKSPQALFAHIKRCRNNLYHGGKFNGRWLEPDRSRELISNSLTVLESLRCKHDKLNEAISGNSG